MTDSDTKDIFEIAVEVERLPGSKMPPEYIGAFVCCYVPARDIREAIDIAYSKLEEDLYEVLSVNHANRIDLNDWDQEQLDEGDPTRNQLSEALESDEVLYSTFDSYESFYEH